jgi:ABC-type transport system involved in multi-copper enzyme maturation permease subunit
MRLYTKSAGPYLLILLAALIPVVAYLMEIISKGEMSPTPEASDLLSMVPYMIVLVPAVFAGRILSSEFKNRTAYLTFPLPVSRTVFFTGKFLAALTLSIGIVLLGYGLSIITADILWDATISDGMIGSLMVCLAGTFAIAGTAYGLSTFLRRGSLAATVVIMIVLPLVLIMILPFLFIWMGMSEDTIISIFDTLTITPLFAGDVVLNIMNPDYMMFLDLKLDYGASVYSAAYVLWGALFLLLGLLRVNRKEL